MNLTCTADLLEPAGKIQGHSRIVLIADGRRKLIRLKVEDSGVGGLLELVLWLTEGM